MKITISESEAYPVYYLSEVDDPFGDEIEAPDEKVAEWRKVIDAFWVVQEDIQTHYLAAQKARIAAKQSAPSA